MEVEKMVAVEKIDNASLSGVTESRVVPLRALHERVCMRISKVDLLNREW
jgi:hypothetical protein